MLQKLILMEHEKFSDVSKIGKIIKWKAPFNVPWTSFHRHSCPNQFVSEVNWYTCFQFHSHQVLPSLIGAFHFTIFGLHILETNYRTAIVYIYIYTYSYHYNYLEHIIVWLSLYFYRIIAYVVLYMYIYIYIYVYMNGSRPDAC